MSGGLFTGAFLMLTAMERIAFTDPRKLFQHQAGGGGVCIAAAGIAVDGDDTSWL